MAQTSKLFLNKRPTIGFQIANLKGRYGNLLLPGIKAVAQENECNFLIFNGEPYWMPYGQAYQHNLIYEFINPGVIDVLIMATGTIFNYVNPQEMKDYISKYAPVPLVSIGQHLEGVPSVMVDSKSGIRETMDHLLLVHKYRRVAFIRGPQGNQEADERFEAYCEALAEYGIAIDENLVAQGDFAPNSVEAAVKRLLDRNPAGFEAILSANDDMALEAMEVLRRHKFSVPQDIAVTGYDNLLEDQNVDPQLTSIQPMLYEQGKKAAEIALSIIQGKEVPGKTILRSRLVVRSSCGCMPEPIRLSERQEVRYGEIALEKADQLEILKTILSKARSELPDVYLQEETSRRHLKEFIALTIGGMVRNTARMFLEELSLMITEWMVQKRDIASMHSVLTLFRNVMASYIEKDKAGQFENLIHQSRIMISEKLRALQSLNIAERDKALLGVLYFTQKMMSTLEMEPLMQVISDEFPKIGVNSCYISLYENPAVRTREDRNWNLPEKIFPWLAMDNTKRITVDNKEFYSTRKLLPEGIFKEDRPYLFFLKPLFLKEEQYGFILFETDDADGVKHETMRMEISGALKTGMINTARQIADEELMVANLKLLENNEKLKELDKAKTDFFSNVSHEIRTPLTLILGPLELLMAGDFGDSIDTQSDLFKSMHNNGNRLLKLINTLLDFSKIEAGKLQLSRKRTNVGSLIKFYLDTIHSALENRKLSIRFDNKTGEDGVIAWVDRELMENAFFNLISNAMKFTPEGGTITVGLSKDDANFTLWVKDTGIGIPEDKLQYIFDRFSQLDSSASRKYQGTGIGLAFTKEIVVLHGGKILVESKVNVGSQFSIVMPLGSDKEPGADQSADDFDKVKPYQLADFVVPVKSDEPYLDAPQVGGEKHEKILIIDDNTEMRRFLRSILEKDFIIISAENGQEGLEKAIQEKPDLILCDVMMPGMDGYEVTRMVKTIETLKGIPIILLTAKADVSMKIVGLETGADDFLSKPFNSRELRARIKTSLEMKKLRDNLAFRKEVLEEIVKDQTRTIEEEKNYAIVLQKKAEKQLEDFLLVLASAIESKDSYTGGHVDRVANYARDLARKLGLPENQVRDIYLGAIVHDVGKIGIKDIILNKPGKLDLEEMKQIQLHAEIGKKLLVKIESLETAVMIAYCHQERWDGEGYPQGLKGEEIPLAARIVTIVDYWDAIITDRPYRKAMRLDKALKTMKSERGKAFDPELFDLFMNGEEFLYTKYISPDRLNELEHG